MPYIGRFLAWALIALMAFVPFVNSADTTTTFRQFADALIRGGGVIVPGKEAIVRAAGDSVDADLRINKTVSMINLATMGKINNTEDTLTGGLVVGLGNKPGKFLIRAVGPGLSQFGVSGALSDPFLEAYKGTTQIIWNDDWHMGTIPTAQLKEYQSGVGAFPLVEGSYDALLVLDLTEGNYSFVVKGNRGSTGTVLLEIYRIP